MRYSLAAIALAATTVYAQALSDLPSCALSCLVTALPETGCSATDFACVCKAADKLTPAVTPCAEKACDAADIASLPAALEKFCAAAGVTITVSAPGGASTSAPATAVPSAPSTSSVSGYPVPSSTVSGAPSGTGAAPTGTQTFINSASSNDFKIGAAALAAVAAIVL